MCCKKYFFRCILILAAFGISIFAVTENLVEFIEVKGDPQARYSRTSFCMYGH